MRKFIKNFLSEEDATTAVEYCVMLAVILLAIIVGVTSAGGGTRQWWQNIVNDFTTFGM